MPHWVWWQWALAIVGGGFAFIFALVLIAAIVFVCAIAIGLRREHAAVKKNRMYATVLEKITPALSFGSGAFGDDMSLYPWELGEPAYYELRLRVHYPVSSDPDDDDPYIESLDFTAVVSQEVYDEAVVGSRIRNPLYEEPAPRAQYATEPVS